MSGVSSKDLNAMQLELRKAVKQSYLLESSNEPLQKRLDELEARQATFFRRLSWLVLGR